MHCLRFSLGAIGATSGVWQHIANFAWWHMQGIFNSSTMNLHIKNLNFIFFLFISTLKKFPCNIITNIPNSYNWFLYYVPEIAAKIYLWSICYSRCCLARPHANVIMQKSQYAVDCQCLPQWLQAFAQGGFSTCWIQICHQICSLTTPGIQTLTPTLKLCRQWLSPCLHIFKDIYSAVISTRPFMWCTCCW